MPALRGENLPLVKRRNLASVLTALYRFAPLSRAEIAERLQLTPATITNIVSELIAQGLVRELDKAPKQQPVSGRRPIGLDLIPESRMALGLSLGRDKTRCVLTDLRGRILRSREYPVVSTTYDTALTQLQGIVTGFLADASGARGRIFGLGIATPGLVNAHEGIVKSTGTERIPWHGRPLAADLSARIGLPVRLENNVRARACAVSLFQPELLDNYENFAFCHVSWGIACPLILGNAPLRGEDAAAGEIGKMIINPADAAHGDLESLASVRALLRKARAAMAAGEARTLSARCPEPGSLTLGHLLAAQRDGDPFVCGLLAEAMTWLGITLANIVDFINPHLIFLSGDIFENTANVQTVSRVLHEKVFYAEEDQVRLVPVLQGDYGDAVGGAACCIDKFLIRG